MIEKLANREQEETIHTLALLSQSRYEMLRDANLNVLDKVEKIDLTFAKGKIEKLDETVTDMVYF